LDRNDREKDPRVLVDFDLMDDAGVYQLTDDLALVQTVDFFTPIADDPFTFGQIAVTNALSDVYAMGAKPLTALSVACFPEDLDPEILAQILKGGESKLKEAGVALLGGHTVNDKELKYGLSVTGTVHPLRVLTNAGAEVGDILILTKPLGTAVLTTALKAGLVTENDISQCILSMATLNKRAMEVMVEVGVNGCTDITGFGLIGHGVEMAKAANLQLEIDWDKLPLFPQVMEFIEKGAVPGGSYSNLEYFQQDVFLGGRSQNEKLLLFDPQTSGGLLISVSPALAEDLLDKINSGQAIKGAVIGQVKEKTKEDPYLLVV
jgi:selenide,water dikinase